MSFPAFFFFAGLAGLVQVAFLNQIRVFCAGPDLFLAMTVIGAVSSDAPAALLIGAVLGAAKDLLDPGQCGLNVVTFAAIAFAVSRLNRILSLDTGISCAVIAALAAVSADIVAWIILSWRHVALPHGPFARVIFFEAAMTAVVVPPLLSFVRARGRALR